MKKRVWIPGILLLLVVITYYTGPGIPKPEYSKELPELPAGLAELEKYISDKEAGVPVREDNQARILWQDPVPQKTEYSVVYLHGFAGSYMDGFPVNVQVADTLNANLYLSRWAGHGLKPSAALEDFSPEAAWESAKEALAIGKKLGKKVIILSTSTGGTLALKLAASFPEDVYVLINMSPNIEDEFSGAFVLNSPWGYELAELISFGDHRKVQHEKEIAAQYWDTVYPSKALVDLQVLLGTSMTPNTFKKITCPVLTLYYYENFLEEDEHVEVEIYPEVHNSFSTPAELKKLVKLEEPKSHFLGSDIKAQNTRVVLESIVVFLKENLGIELGSEKSSPSSE